MKTDVGSDGGGDWAKALAASAPVVTRPCVLQDSRQWPTHKTGRAPAASDALYDGSKCIDLGGGQVS